jgi:uncharacterized protein (TIGR03437 family)
LAVGTPRAGKPVMLALAAAALAIPLHFESNRGQWNSQIRFRAVTPRYTVELSDTAITMNFRGGALRMNFAAARLAVKTEGLDEMPGRSNYYFGADRSRWRTGIPNFARVRYRNLFPGVDLELHGSGAHIEYDWIVAPGADPRSIFFSISGAERMRVDSGGDLVIETGGGEVRNARPRVFQQDGKQNRTIPGRFVLNGDEVRFEVGDYDSRKPLVIDPVLVVNTSFGGSGIGYDFPGSHTGAADTGTGIATDSNGNIYVAGTTYSTNFPLVNSLEGAPSEQCQGNCGFESIFVTKFTPDGGTMLYSTYIGAPSAPSTYPSPAALGPQPLLPASIAVDSGGTVYLTGGTSGENFPGVTQTPGGEDAFLLKLNPDGAFLGTILFGGSADDVGTSIVLGPDGYIYLAGTTQSSNFPVTTGAYQAPSTAATNVFAVKISFNSVFGPTNGTVIYSAIVGPVGQSEIAPVSEIGITVVGAAAAVAADASGNAYIAAMTDSTGWQTTAGVVQPSCAGASCADVAIAKLDPLGQNLIYATYLGGSQTETLGGVAVDSSGSVYVAGTTSSTDFPVTPGAFETQWSGSTSTGFVAKLSPDFSKLVYATYLGGSATDAAMTIAVDGSGNAYAGGATVSSDFPLRYPIQSTLMALVCGTYTPSGSIAIGEYSCPSAGFLSVLNPSGNALVWSTYLGSGTVYGMALDSSGDVYATGTEVTVNAPQAGGATSAAASVLKIAPGPSGLDVPANSFQNAASYAPGLPLPGGLASVYVRGLNVSGTTIGSGSPLPTELAGVSILVNGVAAPILAIASLANGVEQINFQVPFGALSVSNPLDLDQIYTVEIRYQGASVFGFPGVAGPGIFTLSDGTPAVQHSADYSLVTPSNPAQPGETIIVYGTGLGQVSPAMPSGVAATGPAAAIWCQGFSADETGSPFLSAPALYAGLTPGAVGLYQLNIQLPQNLPSGTAQFVISSGCGNPYAPVSTYQSNTFSVPVQ